MGNRRTGTQENRRYLRASGPFDGHHLGYPITPVLIYELNLGGGFVNFPKQAPLESTLQLQIDLPREDPITVRAETVYRHQFGVAVRFVDVDTDTAARLARVVDSLTRNN